jgi:hypothetical protein
MKQPCAHVVVTVRLGLASSSGFGFCILCARPLVRFPGHFCDDTETQRVGTRPHGQCPSPDREALGVGAEGLSSLVRRKRCTVFPIRHVVRLLLGAVAAMGRLKMVPFRELGLGLGPLSGSFLSLG